MKILEEFEEGILMNFDTLRKLKNLKEVCEISKEFVDPEVFEKFDEFWRV